MRFVPLLLLLTLTMPAYSQCPDGACPDSGGGSGKGDTLAWHAIEGSFDQIALYRGPKQVGAYDYTHCLYRPLTAGVWGSVSEPPIDLPTREGDFTHYNFGVDRAGKEGPKYRLNGKIVSRERVKAALVAAGKLDDDSARHSLTVIGSEAKRKAFLIQPEILAFRGKVKFHGPDGLGYNPSDWQVKDAGFVCDDGQVVLQDSTGKVIHRQRIEDGNGPILTALRKADPNYKPAVDPNGTPAIALPKFEGPWLVALVIAGGVLAIFLTSQFTKAKA